MGEENKPAVSRRRLLRRAGTVAAGMGVVGAASAVAASPAQAADSDPMLVGQSHTGTSKTSLDSGNNTTPTFKLSNPNAAGVPLELKPVQLDVNEVSPVVATAVPAGSTYVDNWGDVHVIGKAGGSGTNLDLMSYSATWSTQPFPITTFRLVDTRGENSGTYNASFGYGTFYVSGANFSQPAGGINGNRKLLPKNGDANTPDMVVDLSSFLLTGGFAAVQANLTIAAATADGFAAVYSGPWLGTSSINYGTAQFAIANFVQTPLNPNLTFNVKTQGAVVVIVDLVGFVVSDPINQGLGVAGAMPMGMAAITGGRAAAAAPKNGHIAPRR